jgi:hypothetical protein
MSYGRDGREGSSSRLIKIPTEIIFGWPNNSTPQAIRNSKINQSQCCLCPRQAFASYVREAGFNQFRLCRSHYLEIAAPATFDRDERARASFDELFGERRAA